MKKLVVFLVVLVLVGCGTTQNNSSLTKTKNLLSTSDIDENGGADSYNNAGDHTDSKYWVNPDYYNMKNSETLTILENYKSMNQTAEWSCGNAAALTALNHLGITKYNELDIAKIMTTSVDHDVVGSEPGSANNFYEYGSNVKELVEFYKGVEGIEILETSYIENPTADQLVKEEDGKTPYAVGNIKPTFVSSSLYSSENSDDTDKWVEDAKDSYFVKWLTGHLKAGHIISVEWSDWDGHWVNIIGYDSMGTPGLGDDVLIFADSYDTGDHYQDGYTVYALEKFFYMWKDFSVAPKPYQLQPFVVIGKK